MKVPEGLTGMQVAKRMIFLAYRYSPIVGMGILQARNNVTEEDVWNQTFMGYDAVCSDYIFGHMVKTSFEFTEDSVTWSQVAPNPDYQGWATLIPTYGACLIGL